MAKGLSFSYSKMGMYKECPQKYKFRYVHMLPEQPKYYFAFGSALHEVMEYIYNPKTPRFPTVEQALAFFKKNWDATSFDQKGYASMEKEALGFEEGKRIIRAYYEKYQSSFQHPLSVEMKSTLDMDGLSLISILDRIDYLGGGHIKILDYKTGKTVQREPDQLMMYQKVAENSPMVLKLVQSLEPSVKQVHVSQMSFYHLPSLTEMSFERCDDKEMYEFWQRVLGVADNIRAARFSPAPEENKCRWCDYRNICPVFTGKEYEGPNSLNTKSVSTPVSVVAIPKTDEEILSDQIDRLGVLLKEEKKLRTDIVGTMKKLNFKRHFGSKFQAELAEKKQAQIPEPEKMVALLKELNLLSRTLVPTRTTVLALLEDDSVPQEAKTKICALLKQTTDEQLDLTEAN